VSVHVDEHNGVLPHSASRGRTPGEMYFGTGDWMPAPLTSHASRRPQGTNVSEAIGVVGDMPGSQRGRLTIVPITESPRLAAKPARTVDRTSRNGMGRSVSKIRAVARPAAVLSLRSFSTLPREFSS
jgi:hypothetical protein